MSVASGETNFKPIVYLGNTWNEPEQTTIQYDLMGDTAELWWR